MTTFGTLVDLVQGRLGVGGSTAESEVKQAIVDAISHYESAPFWFLDELDSTATLTSSTADGAGAGATVIQQLGIYEFPASPKLLSLDAPLRIKWDTAQDPIQMHQQTWSYLDGLRVEASVFTGYPTDYATRGEKVLLYPIPNGVHTLYWTGRVEQSASGGPLTTSSADSETNAWMVEGAELIKARATELVKQDSWDDQSGLSGLLPHEAAQGFLSRREASAYQNLVDKTNRRLSTGRNAVNW